MGNLRGIHRFRDIHNKQTLWYDYERQSLSWVWWQKQQERHICKICICSKKKSRQNMYPLLNGSGTMFMQNIAKDEILNVFFALLERSVFKNWRSLKLDRTVCMWEVWSKEDIFLTEEDQVRKYLSELGTHKPMDTDVMHPSVERASRCHYKDTFGNLSMIMAIGSDIQGLEESKCHFCLQNDPEGRPYKLVWHIWVPCERDGTTKLGNYFWSYERHRGNQE